MNAKRTADKPTEPKTARATVNLTPETLRDVELIAQEMKVSVAWVLRDAVEQYVANKWPLFSQK